MTTMVFLWSFYDIYFFFFFNDTATTEIYTLSLHDALPIYPDAFKATSQAPRGVFQKIVQEELEKLPPSIKAGLAKANFEEIRRAHVWTPVTPISPMPSSAWQKKKPPKPRSGASVLTPSRRR